MQIDYTAILRILERRFPGVKFAAAETGGITWDDESITKDEVGKVLSEYYRCKSERVQ